MTFEIERERDISREMRRVVLDTDILVTALRSATSASHAVMREVGEGRLVPLLTPVLYLEYEAALKRPEQRQKHRLNLRDIDHFLAALASACEEAEINSLWRPRLLNPNDDIMLKTAVTGLADALVTHDVRRFSRRKPWSKLQILRPPELMKELGS